MEVVEQQAVVAMPSAATTVHRKAVDDLARARREAAVLDVARHPGVVELLGYEERGCRGWLTTASVLGAPLATVGVMPAEEAAAVVAAVAATVADLHDAGIVHGSLAPEHILLTPEGRPVLCGFAAGGRVGEQRAGEPTVAAAFRDPSAPADAPLRASADVYALGALLRALVPAATTPVALAAHERADQATTASPDERPTARALAGALHDVVPAARLAAWRAGQRRPGPRAARPPAARPQPARRRPWALVVAALAVAAVAAVVVLGGARLLHRGGRRPVVTASAEPAPASATGNGAAVQAAPVCPAPTTPLHADVDGDGCADALTYHDGVLSGGGRRWTLGQTGDVVVAGRWDCGPSALALLRPATGEVFRVDGWATADHDVVATHVADVRDATALTVVVDGRGAGCDGLRAEREAAAPVDVAVGP